MIIGERLLDRVALQGAIDDTQENAFGFANGAFDHEAVLSVLEPGLFTHSGVEAPDTWHYFAPTNRPEELKALHAEALGPIQEVSPNSNLEHVHMLKSPWDGTHLWHKDRTSDDLAAAGYVKGRFRIGLNMSGSAVIEYVTPGGFLKEHEVEPGTAYVIDNSTNPKHRSRRIGNVSLQRNLLVLTDVWAWSEHLSESDRTIKSFAVD